MLLLTAVTALTADAVALEEGAEIPVAPGETVDVVLELSAGELLNAVFEQRGIDLAISVLGPGGAEVWRRDNLQTATGHEDLWLVSEVEGPHTVRLSGRGDTTGSAVVTRLERRPAGGDDRIRVAAERAMATARREHRSGTPEALERARAAADEAADGFGRLALTSRRISALYQLGMSLRDLSRFEEATAVLGEGIALATAEQSHREEASLRNALAGVHWRRGELAEAAAEAERARRAAAAARDLHVEAWTLNNLAIYRHRLGRVDLALEAVSEAADLFARAGDTRGALAARLNLGLMQLERGDADTAIAAFHEVLAGARETGDLRLEGTVLHNLGDAYGVLGDHVRAAGQFELALAARRELGDDRRVASSLMGAGSAAGERGDAVTARARFEEALALYRAVEDRDGEAEALHQLGVLAAADEAAEGLAQLGRALDLRREIGDLSGEAETLVAIGSVRLAAGDPAGAATTITKGLTAARSLEDPYLEAEARHLLARAALAGGRPEAALAEVDRALELVESVRSRIGSEELRATWMAAVRHYAELRIELLLELGRVEAAFEASERARARLLVDLLGEVGVPLTTEPGLAERLADAEARITVRQRELLDERLEEHSDPERVAGLEDEVAAAFERYRNVREAIRTSQPRRAAYSEPRPASVTDARRLLGPDAALLEYLIGDGIAVAFVVTDDRLEVFDLGPSDAIAAEVDAMRRALESPGRRGRARADLAAAALYRTTVAPAMAAIGDRSRLLVVPDGPLHAVPFDALVTSDPATRRGPARLLDRFVVSTAPSVTVLRLLADERRPDRTGARLAVAGFADPPAGSAAAADLRTGGFVLGPLPESRRELADIAAVVGQERALLFVGDDATEARLGSSSEVSTARALHLATHGLVDDRRPERTALLLAPSAGSDGLLHTFEVFELELDNDLVVLSACRTGLGREVNGEGMLGLSHAFFHAGARSLVVSLWRVADTSTRELMVRFYRHLEEHDAATALTRAKRELAARSATADPFHWAGFVLVGGHPGREQVRFVHTFRASHLHPPREAAGPFTVVPGPRHVGGPSSQGTEPLQAEVLPDSNPSMKRGLASSAPRS